LRHGPKILLKVELLVGGEDGADDCASDGAAEDGAAEDGAKDGADDGVDVGGDDGAKDGSDDGADEGIEDGACEEGMGAETAHFAFLITTTDMTSPIRMTATNPTTTKAHLYFNWPKETVSARSRAFLSSLQVLFSLSSVGCLLRTSFSATADRFFPSLLFPDSTSLQLAVFVFSWFECTVVLALRISDSAAASYSL